MLQPAFWHDKVQGCRTWKGMAFRRCVVPGNDMLDGSCQARDTVSTATSPRDPEVLQYRHQPETRNTWETLDTNSPRPRRQTVAFRSDSRNQNLTRMSRTTARRRMPGPACRPPGRVDEIRDNRAAVAAEISGCPDGGAGDNKRFGGAENPIGIRENHVQDAGLFIDLDQTLNGRTAIALQVASRV
jgi:hypothetical protein